MNYGRSFAWVSNQINRRVSAGHGQKKIIRIIVLGNF